MAECSSISLIPHFHPSIRPLNCHEYWCILGYPLVSQFQIRSHETPAPIRPSVLPRGQIQMTLKMTHYHYLHHLDLSYRVILHFCNCCFHHCPTLSHDAKKPPTDFSVTLTPESTRLPRYSEANLSCSEDCSVAKCLKTHTHRHYYF